MAFFGSLGDWLLDACQEGDLPRVQSLLREDKSLMHFKVRLVMRHLFCLLFFLFSFFLSFVILLFFLLKKKLGFAWTNHNDYGSN
jgi:hypothetical protein